jgi:hypothetical protein
MTSAVAFPNERLGLVIPIGKPRIDGTFEFFDTTEGAAADHAFRDQGEEAFHLIEPRTAGGDKVEIEVAVLFGFEPPLYRGALVRAVVIQNECETGPMSSSSVPSPSCS